MTFRKVKIITTPLGTELLPAELLELGITGFEIDDAPSFEEFLNDKRVPWDYVDEKLLEKREMASAVIVYLCENNQGDSQLESIKKLCKKHLDDGLSDTYGTLAISVNEVAEEDWANNWKQYFKPLKIGDKIIIKPSWETISEEDEKNYKVVKLDPGSSFGTGQHETTKLCLEILQGNTEKGCKVLDMGCGSGILTIASMLLGAGSAVAVDIDENACNIARENLSSNGFSEDAVTVLCGDATSDKALYEKIVSGGPYKLILANIVADVLCAMTELFTKCLADDGVLIASGILGERVLQVRRSFEAAGLKIVSEKLENEWSAITVKK